MNIFVLVVWTGLVSTSIAHAGIANAGTQNENTREPGGVDDNIASNMVEKGDSFSMYRKLMNMRESLLDKQAKEDSDGLKMVKTAIKVILETTIHSFINGFLPTVERVRRDAPTEERSYLDGAVYLAGAFLGRQRCSQMIACRTGKFVQDKMPGAQLAVMMAESMIPSAMLDWFGVVKVAVIDRADNCEADYQCTLSGEDDEEDKKNL
jgi:hypothetical protein